MLPPDAPQPDDTHAATPSAQEGDAPIRMAFSAPGLLEITFVREPNAEQVDAFAAALYEHFAAPGGCSVLYDIRNIRDLSVESRRYIGRRIGQEQTGRRPPLASAFVVASTFQRVLLSGILFFLKMRSPYTIVTRMDDAREYLQAFVRMRR